MNRKPLNPLQALGMIVGPPAVAALGVALGIAVQAVS